LESEDVEEKVDMTHKVFVPFYSAWTESFFSGEIPFLPRAATIMVVVGAGIEPEGCASTSIGRRAWGTIVAVAAKTSACIATNRGGRV
jgi:hypothetical protein